MDKQLFDKITNFLCVHASTSLGHIVLLYPIGVNLQTELFVQSKHSHDNLISIAL